MLTRLVIRNFKRFEEASIDLAEAVVFIGPNNSGKTSALQALALWELGLRTWIGKRAGGMAPEKRPRVALARHAMVSLPTPNTNHLWRRLRTQETTRDGGGTKPAKKTRQIVIDIEVEGYDVGAVADAASWSCALEFVWDNDESVRVGPKPGPEGKAGVPEAALGARVALLPPMSGLTAVEQRIDRGAIDVLIGEGRTAQVLRNLCHLVAGEDDEESGEWRSIVEHVVRLFGVTLRRPRYVAARGEIRMEYEHEGTILDLSAAGRGLQQTLLLLTYMHVNPGAALLLDEPDAHLEILRQRQIYDLLCRTATTTGSQIIAASHSEVLLNEAAARNVVVAFVGAPHRIDRRDEKQVQKALVGIGFQHYAAAEQVGWVLYLEGATDLAMLQSFARSLEHPAAAVLELAFVEYVGNDLSKAENHFHGLRVAKPDLVGLVILDRDDRTPNRTPGGGLACRRWSRRELENYLADEATLASFAEHDVLQASPGPLFDSTIRERAVVAMKESFREQVPAIALRDDNHPYWADVKASDVLLPEVFRGFYRRLGMPNRMSKRDFHELAAFVPSRRLDAEVVVMLDAIVETASAARPRVAGRVTSPA